MEPWIISYQTHRSLERHRRGSSQGLLKRNNPPIKDLDNFANKPNLTLFVVKRMISVILNTSAVEHQDRQNATGIKLWKESTTWRIYRFSSLSEQNQSSEYLIG